MNALDFLSQLAKNPVKKRNGEHIKTMSFLAKNTGIADYPVPIILITGTCGKGSTGIFLSSILEANGYQVGLVQSPHLISFSERIQINRNPLDESQILHRIEQLMPAFQASAELYPLNYNQVFLTTGLHLFKDSHVDIVIVESGIGGYSDPCSFFDPILSIITNIHMDHEFILGNSYESIAYDKSGVIKYRRPVVTGTGIQSALEVIYTEASKKEAPLFVLNHDFRIREVDGQVVYEEDGMLLMISIGHLPDFQWENAALAIKALQELQIHGFRLDPSLIIKGIELAKPPGRFEIVSQSPLTVIDGAHNEEEIRRFCESVGKLGCKNPFFIVSFSSNKDIRGMINRLHKLGGTIILTPHSNLQRTPERDELLAYCREINGSCLVVANLEEAYNYALEHAEENDGIFITGSMFLAGDALKLLRHHG